MKSTVKRFGIKCFRWFVNKTGLLENPTKASNRLMLGLFVIFAVTTGLPYIVDLGQVTSIALMLIGIGAIFCSLAVMILGMSLETDRRGNQKLRDYLDSSQTRLDTFQNTED